MILAIDIGNTRAKFAMIKSESDIQPYIVAKDNMLQEINKIAGKIDRIIMTTVDEEIPLHNLPVLNIHKDLNFGFFSHYQSMDTIGMDRLALISGAVHKYPDQHNLVISCGTCITYNFVTSSREFLGGAISPGIKMRMQAMHEFTAKLPLVDIPEHIDYLGTETISCMQSGAIHGVLGEIQHMISLYEHQFGKINAVLTGGDALYLAAQLNNNRIFADTELIYEGMYHIHLLNPPK